MYAYVKGKLAHATPICVTLEANGVGYKIFVPASLFGNLPALGQELLLYTSFVVRELSQALYGFASEAERDFFEALMGVSGIGPKLALSLIGHLGTSQLQQAIASGDNGMICRVPGIGKKNSERLIIELRDKVGAFSEHERLSHSAKDPNRQKVEDAMQALIHLGYNQATAQKAIKKSLQTLPEGIPLAELITVSLQNV